VEKESVAARINPVVSVRYDHGVNVSVQVEEGQSDCGITTNNRTPRQKFNDDQFDWEGTQYLEGIGLYSSARTICGKITILSYINSHDEPENALYCAVKESNIYAHCTTRTKAKNDKKKIIFTRKKTYISPVFASAYPYKKEREDLLLSHRKRKLQKV
jgi:hypothetical protein